MDLELSDEQLELQSNLRSVLSGICPPDTVRAYYESDGADDKLWPQMVELGWPALAVPEEAGGLGQSFIEVGLLAEELGRATAPGSLLAITTQTTPLLAAFGATSSLESIAEGASRGAVCFGRTSRWCVGDIDTVARCVDGGWKLSGSSSYVLGGKNADHFLVLARNESVGHVGVFRVEREALFVETAAAIDPALELVNVTLDSSPAEPVAIPSAENQPKIERVAIEAAAAMSLHMVGACRRILEVTLDYAKVRKQYGRVIGSFQALKHRFADLYLSVERANALCYFAACALSEDDARAHVAAHSAKVVAGSCQQLLTKDGLQLHGGIGFTWEQDLHFLLKRAKACESLCGSSSYHRSRLAVLIGLEGDEA